MSYFRGLYNHIGYLNKTPQKRDFSNKNKFTYLTRTQVFHK
nr:MAG TPA: hypothetical protein [Caudoviricetes sp.]